MAAECMRRFIDVYIFISGAHICARGEEIIFETNETCISLKKLLIIKKIKDECDIQSIYSNFF